MKKLLTNIVLIFMCATAVLPAQTEPTNIVLQGVLRDQQNRAVADGEYTMTFSFYRQLTGGNPIWTSLPQSVRVQNGVFSTRLSGFNSNVTFSDRYYIGILVIGNGSELSPRIELTAAPYAMSIRGDQNVIGGTGNIGIGTLTPGEKLEVDGNVKITGNLKSGDSVSLGSKVRFKNPNGGIYNAFDNPLIIQSESAERGTRLLFGHGGTTNSSYGFEINTLKGLEFFTNTPLRLTSSSTGKGIILNSGYSGASSQEEYYISRGNTDQKKNNLSIHTASTTGSGVTVMAKGEKSLLTLDAASGNIGIGTAPNNNGKLDVGGNVYIKGERFIFFNGYQGSGNFLDMNTNVSAADWVGIYAGVNANDFDLRENAGNALEQYCYVKNGTIWVRTIMPAEVGGNTHTVYVMFIRKDMVNGSNPNN